MLPALLLGAAFLVAGRAEAHESRPAYLEIRQTEIGAAGAETWDVLWKVPARGDLRLRLDPRFPTGCAAATPVSRHPTGHAFVHRWTVRCSESLVGGTITIDGLDETLTDVLARIEPAGGPAQTARALPSAPSFAARTHGSPR